MTNGSLMQVESIAECSPWSILQYFWPAFSNNQSYLPILLFFLRDHLRQVLLYSYVLCLMPNKIMLCYLIQTCDDKKRREPTSTGLLNAMSSTTSMCGLDLLEKIVEFKI